MLVMDVDGTLTDGRINICANGELFKSFDIKDGYGISNILPKYGITPVIITGRMSEILSYRMKELGVKEVHQNISDKLPMIRKICEKYKISLDEVAFIGDDCNDLESMRAVGMAFAPNDCSNCVKINTVHILGKNGGCGAVRECIEYLVKYNEELK
jgi:3-deoxy-D-manno-octulosonate 8-phosphate phosphatase (KDO 8-P phosphatase)